MTFAFARLDLRTWLPRTQTLLPLLLVVVAGVAVPVQGLAIVGAALVTSISVAVPFLTDERWRLDTFYALLPITRRAVVTGRAVSLLAYCALATLLATAVTIVVAAVRGAPLAGEVLLLAYAAAAAIVGISFAVQLPVLFSIGYTRGRLIVYAPPLAIAALAWIAQSTGMLAGLQDAAASVPLVVLAGAGFLLSVCGFVVGTVLASRRYRRRDL